MLLSLSHLTFAFAFIDPALINGSTLSYFCKQCSAQVHVSSRISYGLHSCCTYRTICRQTQSVKLQTGNLRPDGLRNGELADSNFFL